MLWKKKAADKSQDSKIILGILTLQSASRCPKEICRINKIQNKCENYLFSLQQV